MKIGDIFESAEGIFLQEALDLCADGKAYIEEIEAVEGVRRFQVVAVPEPTPEEIAISPDLTKSRISYPLAHTAERH